ncbi:uncharacterized protein TNCV_2623641 [Trichonephila clavipes]|nr:uncharacterized protein TNCV_2623641 [Trichonephila clavipes]
MRGESLGDEMGIVSESVFSLPLEKGCADAVTERFSSVSPQFRGRTPWGCQGPPTNLTSGLAARRLFKVPPCREGTIHLQTSMSSTGFERSPNGTAVSVANHYTGWATQQHSTELCAKGRSLVRYLTRILIPYGSDQWCNGEH